MLKHWLPLFTLTAFCLNYSVATAQDDQNPESRPNLLLITVDDMSADSIGAFRATLASTSPHIDRLAAEGICFDLAHVQVGNCYPSRNVMWSGRYPHNSGVEGFYQVKPIDFPVLVDVMQAEGYWVGIRGKVSHSTPYQPYHWDADLSQAPDGSMEHMKDVDSYFRSTRRGIEAAEAAGKPFCINVNISDPHKPFGNLETSTLLRRNSQRAKSPSLDSYSTIPKSGKN